MENLKVGQAQCAFDLSWFPRLYRPRQCRHLCMFYEVCSVCFVWARICFIFVPLIFVVCMYFWKYVLLHESIASSLFCNKKEARYRGIVCL